MIATSMIVITLASAKVFGVVCDKFKVGPLRVKSPIISRWSNPGFGSGHVGVRASISILIVLKDPNVAFPIVTQPGLAPKCHDKPLVSFKSP